MRFGDRVHDRQAEPMAGCVPNSFGSDLLERLEQPVNVLRRDERARLLTNRCARPLVVFVATMLAVGHWVRPHLITPMTEVLGLNPQTTGFGSANGGPFTLVPNLPNLPNTWIYSAQLVDKAGHVLSASYVASACRALVESAQAAGGGQAALGHASRAPAPPGRQAQLQACFAKIGGTFHQVVTYQPSSRYWTFQWYELGIYLGAALVLAGTCTWWIRPRAT